jgi:hypothetical protein
MIREKVLRVSLKDFEVDFLEMEGVVVLEGIDNHILLISPEIQSLQEHLHLKGSVKMD